MKIKVKKQNILSAMSNLVFDKDEIILKFWIFVLISLIFVWQVLSIPILFIMVVILFRSAMKARQANSISWSYRWSIKEALQTQYPEGVIYILENTLKELNKFGINYQPSRSYYQSVSSDNDIKGFPNQTNLLEVIDMARFLSAEWSHYNAVDKSRAMGEIRAKIEPEDMWLNGERIKLTFEQSQLDVYWFNYDAKEIAWSYLNSKDYERAIENYNIAIQIDPHDSRSYCDRGNAYFGLEEYHKAIADYTQAIQINPNYGLAYSNRGIAYLKLKEYHKAIADYTQAIQINPNDDYAFNAYCNRGNAYLQLKKYHKAIADCTQAIQINPNDDYAFNAYWNRGDAYRKLKEYHKAIADYTQTIRINFNDDHTYESVYFSRGLAYFLLKEYNRAIADYNKVIQANLNYASAYNNLGLTYYECGNIDQAIQLFQKSIDIEVSTKNNIEDILESKLALAVALYSKDKQQESIKLAESVLQSYRIFADAKFLEEERGWNEKLIADTQILIAQLSNNYQNYSSPHPNKLHEDDEFNNKPNIQNSLTFQEWLNQNPALQYFSEEDQRKAYQRYLRERQIY